MGLEEQAEELNVLASIFPDEITNVSETEYRIAIKLDITEDEEHEQDPTLILHVQYPQGYPDEAPNLDILKPANAPKHAYLDLQQDKATLLDSLATTVKESLGMAMIFTVVTTLKESAEQLIEERIAAIEAAHDAAIAEAEAEENRKFEGTKVTREAFLEWSRRFKLEMQEEEQQKEQDKEDELKRKRAPKEEKKMTGKELWEKGLAGKILDDDEDEEEGVDVLESMGDLRVR